jgi:CysZ protein
MGDFWIGLRLPFTGLRLIFANRKLFLLSLLSATVTLVALGAVIYLAGTYTDDLVGWLWAKPASWYGAAVWYLVVGLAFVLLLVVGANTVPLLALTPLQDPLSEAAEEACGEFTAPRFSLGGFLRGALVSLGHTLARVAILLAGHGLLLLLHFIPGVGSLAWTLLGALWTALWMGAEYLAGPMARHLLPFSLARGVVRARPLLALGFGAAVYVVLWVPVLNCFFVPMANVGGTLLYRGLVRSGAVPSPLDVASSLPPAGNGRASSGL